MALTQVNSSGIEDGSIVNDDIKSDAAIALSKLASTPAVLTGSMDNTITTVTGANAIQSEANLTFDGTTLGVAGNLVFGNTTQSKILHNTSDASDNKFLTINGGGDASQSRGAGITFYGNEVGSNEGRLWIGAGNSGSANGFINFNTAGLERARIDSSGKVGIGTTSPGVLLHVSGASGVPGLTVENTDNSAREAAIYLKGKHSNGTVRQLMLKYDNADRFRIHTAGSIPIVFETADAERLRIDSGGRVGINNTNMSSFNNGFDDLVIGNGVANTSPGMTIYSHATDIGSISFRDSADTGISGLIQYRHLESSPYMRVMIEGTERVKFTTNGICFGSDTAAANALDDYEESTYTPVVSGTDGWTATSSTADASYVKIGNVCFVTIAYNSSNLSGIGSSAVLRVNLPFTSKASGNNVGQACVSEWSIGTSSISWMGAKVNNNESYARFQYHNGNNNNTNDLTKGVANNSMNFRCTITYITA